MQKPKHMYTKIEHGEARSSLGWFAIGDDRCMRGLEVSRKGRIVDHATSRNMFKEVVLTLERKI